MTDNYGPTTRVTTPDGSAAAPNGMTVQPGQMQGSVYADDSNIAAAEQLRAEQEGATPQPGTTTRIDQGVHRFTEYADGRVETSQEGIVRSDSAAAPTGSVLDGARSQHGAPQLPSQVTGDSLVTYKGVEVSVHFLESEGLVTRNPAGGYSSPSRGDAGAPPTSPSTSDQADNVTDKDTDPKAPESEQNVVETLLENNGSLKGEVFNAAVDIIGDPDRDPGDLLEAIEEFADKPKVSAQFNALRDIKATEAREVVARAGVTDPEAFVLWAKQQGGWGRAMSQHLLEGNPHEAWDTMARTFVRDHQAAVDFSTEDVLGADFGPGVTVARGPDGTPWISVDDFNGPFKEAVARGLVKVSAA